MTQPKLSQKTIFLTAAGFLVVGVIGVLAGHWFVNWRQAEAKAGMYKAAADLPQPTVNEGDLFPNVSLTDANGQAITMEQIVNGKNTAIIYMSPTCGACNTIVRMWSLYKDKLPVDFQVVMISQGHPLLTSDYVKEKEFPYAYYSDSSKTLTKEYNFMRYPRAFGITANGHLAFIKHGPFDEFNPLEAADLIKQFKP